MLKRLSFVLVAVLSLVVLSSSVMAAKKEDKKNDDPKKVFVCKYVGTPGGPNEQLQSGQNPISVSVNAIKGDGDVQVGDVFADKHGNSVVIAFDTGQEPKPTIEDCEPTGNPASPFITATVVCQFSNNVFTNVLTLNNIGQEDGSATVNGVSVEVDSGETVTREFEPGVNIEVVFGEQTLFNATPKCEGGRGAGDPEPKPTASAQVEAPVSGVDAGGGAVMASLAGLAGSLGSVGYGVMRFRKSRA